MISSHIFLALAAIGLVLVVVLQDIMRPVLAHESISSGLTGPMDGLLLGAFALLSAAMVAAFIHTTTLQAVLACASAVMLVVTGLTGWLTAEIGPNGERYHVIATAITFSLAIALQLVTNHTAAMWGITGCGAAAAIATHFLVPNASVTEKVGVLGLATWLVAWGIA